MKNILIVAFTISTSIFTMNCAIAQDIEGIITNPSYDVDTRLVHIPVLMINDDPAYSEIELY